MTDESKKASLPTWQQAAAPSTKDSAVSATNDADHVTESTASSQSEMTTTASTDTKAAAATAPDPAPSTTERGAEEDQREQIRTFLKDPAVEGQSTEKKRTFLQSKGMPATLIAEELDVQHGEPLKQSDFESFRTQSDAPSTLSNSSTTPTSAPPIITYPEFLADAHRPEPLITPGRILTTTYIASAAAALLYGASNLLVKPMTAVLSDARHEFALHSQSKVDELNARLEKMVSKAPGAKSGADRDDSDTDSIASDPTELFQRDVGTQTDSSVQISEAPSQVAFVNNDSPDAQADQMKSLEKELNTLLTGINKQGDAVRDREESVSKLRHYLDSIAYNGGLNVWSNGGAGYSWEPASKTQSQEKKADSIEDLKKEIRNVKGVLLSAKRFPAAAHKGPAPRYRSPAQAPA